MRGQYVSGNRDGFTERETAEEGNRESWTGMSSSDRDVGSRTTSSKLQAVSDKVVQVNPAHRRTFIAENILVRIHWLGVDSSLLCSENSGNPGNDINGKPRVCTLQIEILLPISTVRMQCTRAAKKLWATYAMQICMTGENLYEKIGFANTNRTKICFGNNDEMLFIFLLKNDKIIRFVSDFSATTAFIHVSRIH